MPENHLQNEIKNAEILFEHYFPNNKEDFKNLFKYYQELYNIYSQNPSFFISTTSTVEEYLTVIEHDFNASLEILFSMNHANKEELKIELVKETSITLEELNQLKSKL